MKKYHITWWNVENLFDVRNSPDRPAYLQSRLNRELKGWTQQVLNKKLAQLSKIICQLNEGKGPDLLGLCEVENKNVLTQLAEKLSPLNRNYKVAHHSAEDLRGIDVAFIYDSDLFDLEEQFHYVILKRSATRDLFQVNLRTKRKSNPLIVIGNHWPARSAGVYESEPYRIMAGETLSYWMERIFEIRGNNIPVLIMGDFNDECYNRSLQEYALSTVSLQKVRFARIPRLYNLIWKVTGSGTGTFYFNNFPYVLDQFLVSRQLIFKNSPLRMGILPNGEHAKVEKFPEMVSGGAYPSSIRFGRPASSEYNPDTGFSDHYPVSMVIEEK
jgi:hypothetical protein